jgi:hypothetical protein
VTLFGNMVHAIEVVDVAQSPLGWALLAARLLSYISAITVVVLGVRHRQHFSSGARTLSPAIRIAMGVLAFSAVAVLVLKASYDAGRSWSDLFDAAVLSDAATSPVGMVTAIQVLVVLSWLFLARASQHSQLQRGLLLMSAVVLFTTFVADAAGLTTRSDDYQKFSVTLVEADVVAEFTVAPTRIGAAEVHLYFSPPSGMLSPLKNVSLTFLPETANSAVEVDLIVAGPNHWLGIADFTTSGQHVMTVQAVTATDTAVQYTTKVLINP